MTPQRSATRRLVSFIARTSYDEMGRCYRLPGEKAVFMNPATTRCEIDEFIDNIRGSSPQ